jgi:hypothetical protein
MSFAYPGKDNQLHFDGICCSRKLAIDQQKTAVFSRLEPLMPAESERERVS